MDLYPQSSPMPWVIWPRSNRPKEASLGQLLEHTGIDVQAGGNKTPSEFLNSVNEVCCVHIVLCIV